MALSAFFKLMLPYTLLAAVMLLGMILLRKCVVLGDLQMRESEKVKKSVESSYLCNNFSIVSSLRIAFASCLGCNARDNFGSVCDGSWNF